VKNSPMDNIKVLISLGSNEGSREENLEAAINFLKDTEAITEITVSSIYETEPIGVIDQPWFLNIAISATTSIALMSLMQLCKSIEYAMGRKLGIRWGQRNIDIDILLYGDSLVSFDQIVVPHPRMHERRFVLLPAAEIAGDCIHPVFGMTINELLQSCTDSSVVKELVI
jgi:2-amino-4-hydroxy-6-hydroxymethyldihydropteridine diphosphokinase